MNLRKFSDQVLDTMNAYKSVWPAIAREEYKSGDKVWLEMERAYYTPPQKHLHMQMLTDSEKDGDGINQIKWTYRT